MLWVQGKGICKEYGRTHRLVRHMRLFKIRNLMLLCFGFAGIYAIAITIRFLYAEFVYLPFNSAEFYTEMAFQCVFVPIIFAVPAAFLLLTDLLIRIRKRCLQKPGEKTPLITRPFLLCLSVFGLQFVLFLEFLILCFPIWKKAPHMKQRDGWSVRISNYD